MEEPIKRAAFLQKIEKFITVPKRIRQIEELLELNLSQIKNLSGNHAEKLKQALGVLTVRDLANRSITKDDIIVLKGLGIKPYQISNWILISKMISEAKIDEFLGTQKISIFGLDNAGKTAILHILQGNTKFEIIHNLTPTKGANRITLTKFDMTYQIWDMGGQEKYRVDYITNAERYFINVSIIIYVIDVQDPKRFNKSLIYFKDILNVLNSLNENPEFLIIIHKVDPDIKENKDIRENIQFLKSQIEEILRNKEISYEIITYSIYNWFGESKSLCKDIKEYLMINPRKEHQTIEFLSDSIKKIMNILINLSASLEQRLLNVEESIFSLQEWIKQTGLVTKEYPKIIEKKELKTPYLTKELKTPISVIRENLKSLLKIKSEDED